MRNDAIKLLNQYKETERLMEQYISLLDNKDYAQGKLDLIKSVISDLEKLISVK